MSLLNDHLYISKVSIRLERFKRKNTSVYTFRCTFCGDSKTNKAKTRAYFYEKNGNVWFHCHNCNRSLVFKNWLKLTDSTLYREYLFDEFKDTQNSPKEIIPKKITTIDKKIELPTIESLGKNHLARHYVEKRKIPEKFYSNLFYAKDFGKFVGELCPEKENKYGNEPRLVIPFRNEKGILIGVSGRDLLGSSKSKYMTVKINDDDIKCFFKEPLNFSKKIYVLEGPIDSFFLDNSVATMDSNLLSVLRSLNNTTLDYTFIFDNEKRNSAIISGMKNVIQYGYNLFIRPSYIEEKDINDMVLSGKYHYLQKLIDDNTYNGLEAVIKMREWEK